MNSKHDTQLLNAASDGKINIQEAAQRSAFVGGSLPLQRPVEPGEASSWLVPQLPVSVAAHLEQQCASLTSLVSGRLTAHYSAVAVTQALHSAAAHIRVALDSALPQLRVGGQSHSLQDQQAVLRLILKSGRLKSQFETNTSGGANNPGFRASREAELFNYPLNLPAAERPIYGYLAGPGYEPEAVKQYGVFGIRLRTDVLARTSLTGTDSLDYMAVATSFFKASAAVFVANWPGRTQELLARMAQGPVSVADLGRPYAEVQFHGGVALSDIESVLVHRLEHLPADLSALCAQHGISVALFPC